MRSVEESNKILEKKENKKEGYVSKPIFDFIDFKNIHPDPLHERIRIVETILELTHRQLIKFDEKKSSDLNRLPNQKIFFEWLISIGIKKPFSQKGQSSKDSDPDFKLKQLNGNNALLKWREVWNNEKRNI